MTDDKSRSLRALDALNFCNAGIQTGLGPFMSIFYTAVRHWNPGQIGILIACQSVPGILVQSAVGHMVDQSQHKRTLTAAAAVVVACSAAAIALFPNYAVQIAVQLTIGLAVTVFPAATGAFALGMSGENELSGRVARNETFTHSGNVIFAITAGIAGTWAALSGIFYAAAAFASGMAGSVMFIQDRDVDFEAARAGKPKNQKDDGGKNGDGAKGDGTTGTLALFKDRRILIFTAVVVLFNISNAATLPLVGELLSKDNKGASSAWQIAAAVAVAEIVMVGVAIVAGRKADPWGRKPLFLIAFAFLAIRNGLSVVSHNAYYLISLQMFDGVAAAIYGVLLTLVVADLAKGTGRFNFLQGAVQSAMGLGAFLSNGAFGWLAKGAGFNASFLALSAVAVAGGTLHWFAMPETRPEKQEAEGEAVEDSQPANC